MQTKADLFSSDLADLAEAAKALSHPARLKILRVLADHDSCFCGDIVDQLPLAQATVSRHLKALKDAGLITLTTDGPRSCYCLDVEALEALHEQVDAFFATVLEPTAESSPGQRCATG